MSNFEAKHPRARDGKFTEKQRKEAGVTLSNALTDGTYSVGKDDFIPRVKVNNDWVNITELEGYIDRHYGENLEVTGFSWRGEDDGYFPKDMDSAKKLARSYTIVGPAQHRIFSIYSEDKIAYGRIPDAKEFKEHFIGEYTTFDDFAAGYVNDVTIGKKDFPIIKEFFDYDAYKRDTGLGEEDANEFIENADPDDIKPYFDYKGFAESMWYSHEVYDALNGNVLVFEEH